MAADANRLAAALDYLERIKRQAVDFGGGVASSLADRARDVGGLAYEAFTSDPNIGRMTTAEFADAAAARAPTPRLDAAGQGAVELGRAVLTQPVQTGKALVQGEVDRARQAMTSPRAAGEYAGSMVDPLRLASALRRGPMLELDVYHGSPHRFEEFDASKIGTGEGAQAYGHGIYLAENPEIARDYQVRLSYDPEKMKIGGKQINAVYNQLQDAAARMPPARAAVEYEKLDLIERLMMNNPVDEVEKAAAELSPATQKWFATQVKPSFETYGSFYKADLPDEMVDRMLDWDKPLSEQPEAVRNALKRRITDVRPTDGFDMGGNAKLRDNRKGQIDKTSVSPWLLETVSGNGMARFGLTQKDVDRMFGSKDVSEITGNQILSRLTEQTGSQAKASEYLRQLGIPGIRYLDAGSRGQGGSGTRNFVVFPGEEKKVSILERDGKKLANALKATAAQKQDVEVNLYPVRNQPNVLYLSKIEVPQGQRGQGIGSSVMQDIINQADADGKTITLTPSTAYGATSTKRLKDFYKRFGFVENSGRNKNYALNETMYRLPKKPKE